ncbi:MAG: protein-L-isoaspartate(D-aspartate) O-methyltransferase [Allosphingosinicella sp.]
MSRIVSGALAALALAAPAAADDRGRERETMALSVANMAETAGVAGARRLDPQVMAAIRKVPRHLFVPAELSALAYQNRPLPIGHEQTISQPYIVALMTHLLQVEPGHTVLEIGTGSGYQAAVLAEIAGSVHSIEIVEPLARTAAERLAALGYGNVTVRAGDGYSGWPEEAPFDRIIVTAGAPHVPEPLVAQLKPGGRMVIPVTRSGGGEELMLVTKDAAGKVRRRALLPVRFVPLTRH